MILFETIHFSRPSWLLLLLLVILAAMFWPHRRTLPKQLINFIDAHLLAHLHLHQTPTKLQSYFGWVSTGLLIIGLAGISWQQQPQTTFVSNQRLVIVLDQSLSMYATDVQPNRLTQLKQHVRDLIGDLQEGDVALVAFAGEAYTISPFTQDRTTLTHFLLALDPLIMPIYGSNLFAGVHEAQELLNNSTTPGHIIVFTDDVLPSEIQRISELLRNHSHTLDIIAIGSNKEATILLPDGQVLHQAQQAVTVPVPFDRLQELANVTQADFYRAPLSAANRQHILSKSSTNLQTLTLSPAQSALWIEQGHWFALPFCLWLLLQFRPGGVLLLLLSLHLYFLPELQASPREWIMTNDQQAQQRVDQGDWQGAAALFQQQHWRAASQYALENYDEAAELLSPHAKTAQDHYNLGNSLALSGKIEAAILAYQTALTLESDFIEAQGNLDYLLSLQPPQNDDQSTSSESDTHEESSEDPQDNTADTRKNQESPSTDKATSDVQPATEGATEPELDERPAQLRDEEKLALDQWLRQIQDDPGGLLKRKLWYLQQEKRLENRHRQEDGMPIW